MGEKEKCKDHHSELGSGAPNAVRQHGAIEIAPEAGREHGGLILQRGDFVGDRNYAPTHFAQAGPQLLPVFRGAELLRQCL